MRIVFDLDGTLTDSKHREHFIDGEKKDWDAFFEACGGDAPKWPAIKTLIALYRANDLHSRYRHTIEIWSGRGEGKGGRVRAETIRWLRHYTRDEFVIREVPRPQFFYGDTALDLRMRPDGDFTPDHELKKVWLDEARDQGGQPDLVFDDRQKVVDMWRAEGIPCFQVAPGDF